MISLPSSHGEDSDPPTGLFESWNWPPTQHPRGQWALPVSWAAHSGRALLPVQGKQDPASLMTPPSPTSILSPDTPIPRDMPSRGRETALWPAPPWPASGDAGQAWLPPPPQVWAPKLTWAHCRLLWFEILKSFLSKTQMATQVREALPSLSSQGLVLQHPLETSPRRTGPGQSRA